MCKRIRPLRRGGGRCRRLRSSSTSRSCGSLGATGRRTPRTRNMHTVSLRESPDFRAFIGAPGSEPGSLSPRLFSAEWRAVRRSRRPERPLEATVLPPAGANRSVRELLDRPYGDEQVCGYLADVVVGDLQDPEAATPGHERVANRPVLALGDERGRVDRLTCGELEQIAASAADAPSLMRLRSASTRVVDPGGRWAQSNGGRPLVFAELSRYRGARI
jgi:hypothetical protein